ncbi:peptidoglycan-binding protein [Streptomyces sp. BI20]|uniref:peptidoglycan-binding protein n=1 Tax=Streptomyces sp. BI20 TaxID=3403460 RepID=UPI003C74E2D4
MTTQIRTSTEAPDPGPARPPDPPEDPRTAPAVFAEYTPAADCPCPGCARRRRTRAAGGGGRHVGGYAGRAARRAVVLVATAGAVLGTAATGLAAPAPSPAPPSPGPGTGTGERSGHGAGDGAGTESGAGTASGAGAGAGAGAGPRAGAGSGDGGSGGSGGSGGAGAARDAVTEVDEPAPGAREDQPGSPQNGGRTPLHGPGPKPGPTGSHGAPSSVRRIDRATIIKRAKTWIAAQVPYSMERYWEDGYRQDCSGFVSMAWNLDSNEWTGSLDSFATRITKDELLPGDMLLFHNPANPNRGSHVTLFGGWADASRSHYIAYEQTKPTARRLITPYGYWSNAARYLPYRFTGVVGGPVAAEPPESVEAPVTPPAGAAAPAPAPAPAPGAGTAWPGAAAFGPGANNAHVTRLGEMLIARGGARFYPQGAGPQWTDSDAAAVRAFQRAQGWTGEDADGIPGRTTWQLLVEGRGKDIPPATPGNPAPPGRPAAAPAANTPAPQGEVGERTPVYPGDGVFRPGRVDPAIEALGRRLVARGYGSFYPAGPDARWSDEDRRAVAAFQRAQGWKGASADGYPGPQTWRRLFA